MYVNIMFPNVICDDTVMLVTVITVRFLSHPYKHSISSISLSPLFFLLFEIDTPHILKIICLIHLRRIIYGTHKHMQQYSGDM